MGFINYTITCVASVTQDGADTLNLTIQDSSDMNLASRLHSAPTTGAFYSVNYSISRLNHSDADRYTCIVVLSLANTTLSTNRTLDVTGTL